MENPTVSKKKKKKEPTYHIDNCTCSIEQKGEIAKCVCFKNQKPKYTVYICIEEYIKCPKTLDGMTIHGNYMTCKLCAKVVCHYHCTECHKIIPNNLYIINKIVYHQGKNCLDYCK